MVEDLQTKLTAALARHEEYTKGYHTLRSALKKAKEDIDKQKEELVTLRVIKKDMEAMKDVYSAFKEKQKANTKKVMERMAMASTTGCMEIHWVSWFQDMEETKRYNEMKAELENANGKMNEFQMRKKEEAKKVFARMAASNDTGLIDTCLTGWYRVYVEEKQLKEAEAKLLGDAANMTELQKQKKEQAKAVMARVAAGNDTGLMDTCLTAWYRVLQEEKALKEAEARIAAENGKMTEYQMRKKEDAKKVFTRMAASNDTGLMDTCITAWYRVLNEEKALREAEARIAAENGKMTEYQMRKKEEAKKVFTRMAASNDTGLMDTCITAWYRVLNEEKALKGAEARIAEENGKLTEFQKRKKEEAKKVFARMAAANDTGLMDTCLTGWYRVLEGVKLASGFDRMKAELMAQLESSFDERLRILTDDLETTREDLEDKKDELESMAEELAESRRKNKTLREEFNRIQALQSTMAESFNDWLNP